MAYETPSRSISVPFRYKTTLFKQEEPKDSGFTRVTYRIPALMYITEKKAYFAFAEKRKTPVDTDAEVLVMRRGTWKNGEVQWVSGHQILTSARLDHHRSMNPCPVYEKTSKTIFLFFICVPFGVSEQKQITERRNQARLCYVSSRDTGKTWSHITDLTAEVIGDQERDWATFAVGPGHGIQMQSGRIIIPAYVYRFHSRHSPTPYAFAFYSDDKGHTWKTGQQMEAESCECQMAEIIESEGYLYCNARSSSGIRTQAMSKNSGELFDKPVYSRKLIETGYGCQGSVLSILSSHQRTWLLYSHPTNRHKRENLGIYVNKSPLDPMKWEDCKLIIHHGPSGYSDLAECGDRQHIACLMECGEDSAVEEIAFKVFRLSDAHT